MSKRKPSKLTGIRFEFQERERELIEQEILLRNTSSLVGSIFNSLAMMPPQNLYAWLTLAEALGLVDTPIPTLGDMEEVLNAIKSWASGIKQDREQKKEEEKARQEVEDQARREAAEKARQETPEMNPDYVPTGATPNYRNPTSPDTSDTDYSDPMNRYPTG